MDAAEGMKKTIAEGKAALDEKLKRMYANNKRVIAIHQKRKDEQRRTE
ncbi:hypothetical protein ES703_26020 [subsurface metagenome]